MRKLLISLLMFLWLPLGTALSSEESALVDALNKRKLTHAECLRLNPRINFPSGATFYANRQYAELYSLLVRQWEIQSGITLTFRPRLSSAQGDYGRSPQEFDNQMAVEELIAVLQRITQ